MSSGPRVSCTRRRDGPRLIGSWSTRSPLSSRERHDTPRSERLHLPESVSTPERDLLDADLSRQRSCGPQAEEQRQEQPPPPESDFLAMVPFFLHASRFLLRASVRASCSALEQAGRTLVASGAGAGPDQLAFRSPEQCSRAAAGHASGYDSRLWSPDGVLCAGSTAAACAFARRSRYACAPPVGAVRERNGPSRTSEGRRTPADYVTVAALVLPPPEGAENVYPVGTQTSHSTGVGGA